MLFPGELGPGHSLFNKAKNVNLGVHHLLEELDANLAPSPCSETHSKLLSTLNSKQDQGYFTNKGLDFHLDDKLHFLHQIALVLDHPKIQDVGKRAYELMSASLPVLAAPLAKK